MTTHKPHKQLLELRKEHSEFFDDWATFLETTDLKQARDSMSNGEGTACCLYALEISKGNTKKSNIFPEDTCYPSELYDKPTQIEGLLPEDMNIAFSAYSDDIYPMFANDDEGMSFKQIAQILRGNSVTM